MFASLFVYLFCFSVDLFVTTFVCFFISLLSCLLLSFFLFLHVCLFCCPFVCLCVCVFVCLYNSCGRSGCVGSGTGCGSTRRPGGSGGPGWPSSTTCTGPPDLQAFTKLLSDFPRLISTCFGVPDLKQPHSRPGFARSGLQPPEISQCQIGVADCQQKNTVRFYILQLCVTCGTSENHNNLLCCLIHPL